MSTVVEKQTAQSWTGILTDGVEKVRAHKRTQHRMTEWFVVQELFARHRQAMVARGADPSSPLTRARILRAVASDMPLDIPEGSAIAGTQDCAFSPSYALINPAFKVETFAGYCDPTAIYSDMEIDPDAGFTEERIAAVRAYWEKTPYVQQLQKVYEETGELAREVAFFMEPVTGHTIPDLRPLLAEGVVATQKKARGLGTEYGEAMATALGAALVLADRYRDLARARAVATDDPSEQARLHAIAEALEVVPARPAATLHQAVQSFALLWQVMVLEQSPNPYAFSVGAIDRVLQPYYGLGNESRDEAVALVRHLHAFFQVGNRCWAISQNVLVGGRDADGTDLTCDMTGIVLDAFFASNDPQPALSVRVHRTTPDSLYRSLSRFFFTPGHSTPSVFNDDSMIPMLQSYGVSSDDVVDYAIAGCQEPLIMGKSSLNTTNTWLNLAKVLELACNDGCSLLSGTQLGPSWTQLGYSSADEVYADLEQAFLRVLDWVLPRMERAGNACTALLGSHMPVPFTSAVMDSLHTGCDMRVPDKPGTRYHGSGCLVHGLSVVANSLHAVARAVAAGHAAADIRAALQNDFAGHRELQQFLLAQETFGNDSETVDSIAQRTVREVSRRVRSLHNPAGSSYLPDWSTPSTHLLYGYWTGATPDGRRARQMLGYGVDPRVGTTRGGFAPQLLSAWKLPYHQMNGGYASHIGVQPPGGFGSGGIREKGEWMRDTVIRPLFRHTETVNEAPYYVYFNVDSASHLRAVLADPKKHAPTGVYIMRIHGTFVNFLDLSPAIQEDIIRRLEPSAP